MDDQPPENRRRGAGKRGGTITAADGMAAAATAPCGACKFLRRKCISGCIFAPHFGSDQGGARFAAVHKVFGASNVSKLLSHIPAHRRNDAVVTISYEAQARLSDPVYGCVSTIVALQHQVASLQAELSMVQTELINSRFAMENALQNELQQPSYSNTSSVSNNLLNMRNNFSPNFTENANNFDPVLHISSRHIQNEDEEDEEQEESHDPALVFANHIFQ